MRAVFLIGLMMAAGCSRSGIGLDDLGAGAAPDSAVATAPTLDSGAEAAQPASVGSGAEAGQPVPADSGAEAALPVPVDVGPSPVAIDAAPDLAAPPIDSGVDVSQALPVDAGLEAGPGADAGPLRSCPYNGCTAEERQPYNDCVLARCDLPYRACLGPGYASGVFGGPCQTYVTCVQRCTCDDDACRSACGYPDDLCTNCIINQLAPCVNGSGCVSPVCNGGPVDAGSDARPDVGGASCADLMRCCASVTNASIKTACDAQYAALANQSGTAQSCTLIATQYRTAGYCTF